MFYRVETPARSFQWLNDMENYELYSARTKRRKIKALVDNLFSSLEQDGSSHRNKNPVSGENSNALLTDHNVEIVNNHSADVSLSNDPDVEGCDLENSAGSLSDKEPLSLVDNETDRETLCNDDHSDNVIFGEIREKVASWAVKFKISHSALSALLEVLKSCDLDMPRDPRTLLMTPRVTDIKETAGGSFYHFGIARGIISKLATCSPSHLVGIESLTLHINIDGIPLFGSSTVSLWPILGMIKELPGKPFVIGVYCGSSKPKSLKEYLYDFVQEMKEVLTSGVDFDINKYNVKLDAFICDAPARAFIKCIKGHSGYHGCERCVQKGLYVSGKITFPEFGARLRTDVSFDEMRDSAHHTDISPLKELNVGFVSQFVLDYMHLVCLGIVRKIIYLWMKGPLSCRISAQSLSVVSAGLSGLRQCLPREFARKPRSLSEFKMWKATEFRQFLLYTGPVVLHGKIPDLQYKNFLLLSVAIRMLVSESLCSSYCDYVEKLLEYFVKDFAGIYGADNLVYNVHSLTHIVQDARQYGPLDNISCFPYENMLGELKRMVRRPQNPVAQLIRRISENERSQESLCDMSSNTRIYHGKPHFTGPVPLQHSNCQQYKQYHGDKVFIACREGDNCFDVNNRIVIVKNILLSPTGETFVVFQEFITVSAFFEYPLNSECLGIKVCRKLSDELKVGQLCEFVKKVVLLPCKQCFVAVPFLHHK